ncbi:hypothetical protein LguiA_027274 [Lonicera macranthoides]
MATGVLASRKESSWGQSLGGFMGKIPYSTPQLNPNPNPNPNSKTKPKKKQFHTVNGRHADDSPAVTQTASDDAYSFNQRPIESSSISPNGFNLGEYVNFNVATYSRSELNDLRKRLGAELDRIRSLNNRIESGQLQPRSNGKIKKLSGNKRPVPSAIVKQDPKRICQNLDNGNINENGSGSSMKMCRQLLTKLMKHKHGWVFNKPVDAAAFGLHDYHQIIKRPMDLGTVKSNMAKNLYSSPADFAADVRLTFNNAMLYNPKTDDVHLMAKELLDRFEDMFRPISQKLQSSSSGRDRDNRPSFVADELQGSSWNDNPIPAPEPERVKKPKPSPIPPNSSIIPPVSNPVSKQNERLQNQSSVSNPSNPQSSNPPSSNPHSVQSPVRTPSPVRAQQPAKPFGSRGVTGKQPKPRAKDPNKREMSEEEKHKLGIGLQSLPQEKMPQLVQIIRKRNEHLAQEGDEIELDIEALDTETLWELDRFVTNWKKMVSKTKRQALMGNYSAAPTATADELPSSDRMDVAKRPKKGGEAGEEDVDIGDEMEMPENSFPPLEIEKDEGAHVPGPVQGQGNASSSSSSSSSSGSDSSSSSDSDSGSSSGSDSDADEAQS